MLPLLSVRARQVRRPVEFETFPIALRLGFGPFMGVVRHVVDGDTVDVLVDAGFNDYLYRTIRLADIDAPEKNRLESREAGLASRAFLEGLIPVGAPVVLFTRPDPDSFGRYLAVIKALESLDGRSVTEFSVNQRMVESGHAVWRDF